MKYQDSDYHYHVWYFLHKKTGEIYKNWTGLPGFYNTRKLARQVKFLARLKDYKIVKAYVTIEPGE